MERSRKRKRPMQGYGKMDQARSRWGGGKAVNLRCWIEFYREKGAW